MKTYLYGGPLLDAKELQILHVLPSLFSEDEYERLFYYPFKVLSDFSMNKVVI